MKDLTIIYRAIPLVEGLGYFQFVSIMDDAFKVEALYSLR